MLSVRTTYRAIGGSKNDTNGIVLVIAAGAFVYADPGAYTALMFLGTVLSLAGISFRRSTLSLAKMGSGGGDDDADRVKSTALFLTYEGLRACGGLMLALGILGYAVDRMVS